MLHCSHLNERLEFGMESVAILSHSFINSGGRIIPCRTALVDLGLNDVDPGLAPEGARCADGSLCVNRKCLPVANLKVGPNSCSNNCNGHGICNTKGNCHCDDGYAPPICVMKGNGGSLDSGPASHPGGTTALLTFLYVCLILVPLFLLCAYVAYHRRRIWEMSKERTPEEWRIWMEKTNPATRFIRRTNLYSDQPDGSRPSRPTSLLTHTDISAPMPCENGQSSSSPTHALLPHVDTSTSALSAIVSDNTQRECTSWTENIQPKRGGSSHSGIFSSIAVGIEKSRSKIRCKSIYGGLAKEKVPDSIHSSLDKSTKRSFIETLAKSISLPSTKIRGTMKNNPHGSTKAQYELTVEHQEPRKDSGDHSPPILTPCDMEEKKSVLTDCVGSVQNSPSNLSKDTSKDSIGSIKTSAVVEVKKVDTTVTVTNSNNLIPGSKSLSSFATNRITAPYRTTLPASKSYSFRTQSHNNKDTDIVSSTLKQTSPINTPEKESSSSSGLTNLTNDIKSNIKDSLSSSLSDETTTQSSLSVNNNLQNNKKDCSRYPLRKKYAFPHSFTFSGHSNNESATSAFLPSSKSCDSATTAQILNNGREENSYNSSQTTACTSSENSGSNNSKTINNIEKDGKNGLVSGKITQNSTVPLSSIVSKPPIAKKPPTPPRKPNYLKSKEASNSMTPKASTDKDATEKVTSDTNINTRDCAVDVSTKLKSCAPNDKALNQSLCKADEIASSLTSKIASSPESTIAAVSPNASTNVSSIAQISGVTDKQMPLTKTTTIPTLSNIGSNSVSLTKSSTLPVAGSARPLISKPIFQTATPSAASLIERAPSTGVSQSSILKSNKTGKPEKSSRVVFCESLTLPSPTNPNNPPIIHQQSSTSSSLQTSAQSSLNTVLAAEKVVIPHKAAQPQKSIATIVPENGENATTVVLPNNTTVDFTPTWKTEPKPLPSDAFVCNIDDFKVQRTTEKHFPLFNSNGNNNKDVCISSPDSDKGSEKAMGQFSKFKTKLANVKRTPTGERHKYERSAYDLKNLSPTSSLRSLDGPPKLVEKGNLRSLQISNPILQTTVDIKTSLVPVRRASDDLMTHTLTEYLRSTSISPAPSKISASNSVLSSQNTIINSVIPNISKSDNIIKSKGKAPQPPQRKAETSAFDLKTLDSVLKGSSTCNAFDGKDNKNLLSSLSLRLSNKGRHSERRDSAPETCTTNLAIVPNSPSVSSISITSNVDTKILNASKAELPIDTENKTSKYKVERQPQSSKSKRPASIATTRPVRPTAPPPPRPLNGVRAQVSPTRSDTGSVASSTSSISTTTGNSRVEPIYDTIRENPLEEKAEATSITSPLSDDFVTPTSSPILTRRNSDTVSTGSSTDGGDLMNAILKEMSVKEEEESIYSTLRKKKKNKMSKSAHEH